MAEFIRKKGVTVCPPCLSDDARKHGIEKAAAPTPSYWVRRNMKAAPKPERPKPASTTKQNDWNEKRHELKRLITIGWDYTQLATHFRVSESRIGQMAKRFNLPTPKRQETFSEEDFETMFELRRGGCTYKEIGNQLNLNHQVVRNAMSEFINAGSGSVFRPKVLVKDPNWDFSKENLE